MAGNLRAPPRVAPSGDEALPGPGLRSSPMIRVSVLYPGGDDINFDHDYYRDSHVPAGLRGVEAGEGRDRQGRQRPVRRRRAHVLRLDGGLPGRHGQRAHREVMADVANYTNATPVLQISETA